MRPCLSYLQPEGGARVSSSARSRGKAAGDASGATPFIPKDAKAGPVGAKAGVAGGPGGLVGAAQIPKTLREAQDVVFYGLGPEQVRQPHDCSQLAATVAASRCK